MEENPNIARFNINCDRVKTLEDVVAILKAMNLTVEFDIANPPEVFKGLLERNLLVGIPMKMDNERNGVR